MAQVKLHNPCATTIYTMWKEKKRERWIVLSALVPLAIGFALTFAVAQVVRFFGG